MSATTVVEGEGIIYYVVFLALTALLINDQILLLLLLGIYVIKTEVLHKYDILGFYLENIFPPLEKKKGSGLCNTHRMLVYITST